MLRGRSRAATVAGGVVASVALLTGTGATPAAALTATQIAPYFETTGAHPDNLRLAIAQHGLKSFTAAFVLGKGCTPAWDNNVAVSASPALNKLVSDAKAQGAVPIISFGGQSGSELATVCTNQAALVTAYTNVINRFAVKKIDFDIEGKASLNNTAANTRRFTAINALRKKFPALRVSVTIPAGPGGIETGDPDVGDGMAFLRLAKAQNTTINLINIMTMDYGGPVADMGTTATTAASRAMAQIKTVWPADGYGNLGITPMIGRNDSPGETFTWDNSQTVIAFAKSKGVGRVAFWALNRDQSCTGGQTPPGPCTGVTQAPLDYTDGFLN
jgi:chitinase